MSLPTPSTTRKARSSVQARLASNWIEVFAIPVASAIMEALPVTLALQIFLPFFFPRDQVFPNAASVTLVLLVLHWWMMMSHAQGAPVETSRARFRAADTLAFLGAFALLLVTNPDLLADIANWVILFLLTIAAWGRSYYQARNDDDTDQLILALKIGFLAMLGVLVFALLNQYIGSSDLNNTLITDLPIFFLSGLLALSFKRLSILKQEQARQVTGPRKLKTGRWIVAMTITWVAVVFGSIAFEALPPAILASVANLFLSALGWILNLLAYLFSLLPFSRLISDPSKNPSSSRSSSQQPHALHPTPVLYPSGPNNLAGLIHWLELGSGICLGILIIVVLVLLKKHGSRSDVSDEDEVREKLDKRQIRRERKEARKASFTLEPLDPLAVRARYREFLTVMAARNLPRHANETPDEYQTRLLTLAQSQPESEGQETPPDQALLAELTLAYTRERYGAKPLAREHLDVLHQQMPSLLQYLTKIDPKT